MPNKMWILLDSVTKIQSQQLQTEQLQLAILKMSERDWVRFYVWTPGWQNWQMLKDFLNSDQREFSLPGAEVSETSVKAHIQNQIVKAAQAVVLEQDAAEADTLTGAVRFEDERSVTKSMTMVSSTEDTMSHSLQDYDGHKLSNEVKAPPKAIDFKQINEGYNNRAERHELKIEVLISNQRSQTFKSYSRNISLTGTLLEDNIPFDFYGAQFEVIIVNRHAFKSPNGRVQVKGETVGDGLTQRIRFIGLNDPQKQKLMSLLNEYILQQSKHNKKTG